nr:hypothetical protein [Tanacetum cinerariifolium]
MTVQAQKKIGEGSSNPTDPHHTPTIIQPSTYQPRKKQKYKKPRRKDTEVPQLSVPTSVANEAVNEEMYDSLERVVTTTTSLDVEQDRGGGPRCQEAMRDAVAQTRSERVSKISNDLLLAEFNTSRSGEDSLKLTELMKLCTKLQETVLDLETTKTTQAMEIESLKIRVKKLEKKKRLRTHKLKRLYKVGLSARVESSDDEGLGEEDASKQGKNADIDANEDIYLVNVHNDKDMFGVNDLDGDEVIVESEDVAKPAKEVIDNITLAKALMEIKSAKPKADKVVIQEPEHGTTTTTPTITTTVSSRPKAKGIVIRNQEQVPTPTVSLQQPSQVKDNGKAKMIKEPMKLKKKDQIQLDEEVALKLQEELQAEFKKEQRLENYELAQRLQAEEQDELTDAEKVKLFMEFLEKRRKFFVAKRAEEKKNRPPTKAQQRNIMSTYLKNMDGWKLRIGTTTSKTLSSRDQHGCHHLHATAITAITIYTPPPPLLRLPPHHRHPMAATFTTVTPTIPCTTTIATPPRVFTEGYIWLLRHRRIRVRWFWFNTTKGVAGFLINTVRVFVLVVKREEALGCVWMGLASLGCVWFGQKTYKGCLV